MNSIKTTLHQSAFITSHEFDQFSLTEHGMCYNTQPVEFNLF